MAKQKTLSVTMRARIGDKELEITGPNDYVEQKIAEFLGQTSGGQSISAGGQPTQPQTQHAKAKSPAQFFNATNPKTDVDRALVAAYFLEKNRDAQNVTAAEVRDLIKEAKRPPPINPSDAMNKNIRKGLLMTAGDRDNKIAFVVTSDGEAAVEEMVNASRG